MKARIAYIIVAYHPDSDSFNRLMRILPADTTVVVDNGGTLTPSNVRGATLLTQTSNVGYGAAANIGIRHAIAYGATWFVVVNQDLGMSRKAKEALEKVLQKSDACVTGPFAGAFDTKRWTTMLPSQDVTYISGSCIAIQKNVIEKIGYFYEPYFMYYEDADYCARAACAGVPIIHLDIAGVTHNETTSLGRGSVTHQYYLARNHLLFVSRCAPIFVRLRECVRLPKTVIDHLLRHEKGATAGIYDFLFHRFGLYRGIV